MNSKKEAFMKTKLFVLTCVLIALFLCAGATAYAMEDFGTDGGQAAVQPRMTCPKRCGGVMKLMNRTRLDGIAECEKNQDPTKIIYDYLYQYDYECMSCSAVDSNVHYYCPH